MGNDHAKHELKNLSNSLSEYMKGYEKGFEVAIELVMKVIDSADIHTLPIMLKDLIIDAVEEENQP